MRSRSVNALVFAVFAMIVLGSVAYSEPPRHQDKTSDSDMMKGYPLQIAHSGFGAGHPKQLSVADVYGVVIDWQARQKLSGPELSSNAKAKALISKANRILVNSKQVCSDFHLVYIGPTEFSPTEGFISGAGGQFESPDETFSFPLSLAFYQQPLYWRNDGLEHHLNYENCSKDGSGAQLPWSEEKAIKIGMAFVHVLLDGATVRLDAGKAYVQDRQFGGLDNQWSKRTWLISWNRLDSQGHSFEGNYTMTIPEGYGPLEAELQEIYPFIENKGIMISQATALAIARQVNAASSNVETYEDQSGPNIVGNRLMWKFFFHGSGIPAILIEVDAYTGDYSIGPMLDAGG